MHPNIPFDASHGPSVFPISALSAPGTSLDHSTQSCIQSHVLTWTVTCLEYLTIRRCTVLGPQILWELQSSLLFPGRWGRRAGKAAEALCGWESHNSRLARLPWCPGLGYSLPSARRHRGPPFPSRRENPKGGAWAWRGESWAGGRPPSTRTESGRAHVAGGVGGTLGM